jgi:hypothetical protein
MSSSEGVARGSKIMADASREMPIKGEITTLSPIDMFAFSLAPESR